MRTPILGRPTSAAEKSPWRRPLHHPSSTISTPPTRARRERKRELFQQALVSTACVTEACRAAGIGRETAYRWKRRSRTFREAWEAALDEGLAELEGRVYARAMEGSDRLAMFLLRCHRPQVYGRKQRIEQTVDDKRRSPERIVREREAALAKLSEEERETLVKLVRKAYGHQGG